MEEKDGQYSNVPEAEVTFKLISDRMVLDVYNEELNEALIELSGYDIKFNYNMKYLKSVEDIEMACQGVAELFRKAIMSKLLEDKQS